MPNMLTPITDKRGRLWSITVQVDKVIGQSIAYFDVWPAIRTDSCSAPVGEACCSVDQAREAKLDGFRVEYRYQNSGIGSKLLEEVERWAVNAGAVHLYGDLSDIDADHFPELRHFYTKHGWSWCLFGKGDLRLKPGSPFVGLLEKTVCL
jgi:GNAT superfamily N-acetyltransferase